jgi:predicted lipoprotein with Yx(FWY)xxD motif
MVFPKRICFVVIGLALTMVISACGSTTTGSTQSTPTIVPTIASTFTVQTAQATVKGQATTILTNPKGMTLYYFTPDTVVKTACTGGCATAWPPLLLTGSETPTSSTSLPGKLSTLEDDNGVQVEYSGYLLYTFASDTAPGQTNGEGVGGKWFVATPDLASYVIRITTASVKGKSETILANAQGMTLYYFTPDTATKVACTGGCATAWPPLLATGSGTPLADAPLTVTFSVLNGADGTQVECNGHPLYTFASDTAPGQTNGEGVGGKWFVATPSLAA